MIAIASVGSACSPCVPRETSLTVALSEGQDIAVVRASNDDGVYELKLNDLAAASDYDFASFGFESEARIYNLSKSSPCAVSVLMMMESPNVDMLIDLAAYQIPAVNIKGRSVIPPTEDGTVFFHDFLIELPENLPLANLPINDVWLVFLGCTDAPVEIDVRASADWCPDQRDSRDFDIELEQEIPEP